MALVTCSECKKNISDKAAICINCGAPMKKAPTVAVADPVPDDYATAMPAAESSGHVSVFKWVLVVVFGLLVYQCATFSDQTNSAPKVFSSMDALFMCQSAIKRMARDPEKASIPYVEDMGRGDESSFGWGASTKMARMRNGLGLEVATSASCVVDRKAKRITSLTLDGKSII